MINSRSRRASSRPTGLDSVGWPKTTIRSIPSARLDPASSRWVPSAARPRRALLDGSASNGTPAVSASAATARPRAGGQSPAMITVCGPDGSSVGCPACGVSAMDNSGIDAGATNPTGTSGSLNSTLSCTGPGIPVRVPAAVVISRASSKRQAHGSAV